MRSRLLLVLTLLAAAGAVVTSSAAQAATPTTTRLFYLADTAAHPGTYGLYSRDLGGTGVRTLVAPVVGTALTSAHISPDGSEVAYTFTPAKGSSELRVIDSGGGGGEFLGGMLFGNRHRWTVSWGSSGLLITDEQSTTADVESWFEGSPTPYGGFISGSQSVRYAADGRNGRVLATSPSGQLVFFDVHGGSAPVAVPDAPARVAHPGASADGSTVVFTRYLDASTASVPRGDLQTLRGGTLRTIATGAYDVNPAVGPDDLVYFDKVSDSAHHFRSDLYSVPIDGSSAPTRLTDTPDVTELSVSAAVVPTTYTDSATAKAVTVELRGGLPLLALPYAPRSSPVDQVVCRTPGTTALATPCEHPLFNGRLDTDYVIQDKVTPGQTYTYTSFVTDAFGNVGPTIASVSMQAVGVQMSLPLDYAQQAGSLPISLKWASAAVPGVTWEISYTAYEPPSYAPTPKQTWLTTSAPSIWFGSRDVPRAVLPGASYHFAVVAHDRYGNTSAGNPMDTTVPVDQGLATFSAGWHGSKAPRAWRGAVTGTTVPGASASISLTGSHYFVVGERCPSCGDLLVLADGRTVARVSSHGTTYQPRVALWEGSLGAPKARTITVVAVGTAGHPRVSLDAFAAAI